MSAWGTNASKSCDALLRKVERNQVQELVILPTKTFGSVELDRLSNIFLAATTPVALTSAYVSGRALSTDALQRFSATLMADSCQLTSLAIGDVNTGDEGLAAFVSGFIMAISSSKSVCSLEELDLSYNGHTAKGVAELCKLAERLVRLKALNLSRNALSQNPADLCALPFRNLKELNISSCSLQATHIERLLSPSLSCETIVVSNNPIGDDGLASILSRSPPSKALYASNCDITHIVVDKAVNIGTLDLSKNNIGREGVQTLCSDVLVGTVELDLSDNPHMEVDDAVLLSQHSSLSQLDLSSCPCGVEGASSLVDSKTLKSLRLFNCQLGSEGLRALATPLSSSRILETLDVAGNGADQDSVVELIQAAAVSTSLSCLVVGGNAGGAKVEEAVRTVRSDLDIARDDREN